MTRGLGDLAASAARTSAALVDAQRAGVRRSALHVTGKIRDQVRRDTGDMRLSGVGKRGAKVGAKYDIKGTTNPTALITATGPLHLIERNTAAHSILPRGRRVSKRYQNAVAKGRLPAGGKPIYLGRKKALTIGGGLYSSATRGPTRGKHTFERGWKKAAPDTPLIFQKEIQGVIRREWF